MNGITIDEMAISLGLPYKTITARLRRGRYTPLFSGNLYSKEVFEAIKNTPGKGRPPKEPAKKSRKGVKAVEV